MKTGHARQPFKHATSCKDAVSGAKFCIPYIMSPVLSAGDAGRFYIEFVRDVPPQDLGVAHFHDNICRGSHKGIYTTSRNTKLRARQIFCCGVDVLVQV